MTNDSENQTTQSKPNSPAGEDWEQRLVGLAHWIANPFIRYRIRPTYWRSVWIHWGWVGFGVSHNEHMGHHTWLSLGLLALVHSHNLGQPNDEMRDGERKASANTTDTL
jgi:hypothetical protein